MSGDVGEAIFATAEVWGGMEKVLRAIGEIQYVRCRWSVEWGWEDRVWCLKRGSDVGEMSSCMSLNVIHVLTPEKRVLISGVFLFTEQDQVRILIDLSMFL